MIRHLGKAIVGFHQPAGGVPNRRRGFPWPGNGGGQAAASTVGDAGIRTAGLLTVTEEAGGTTLGIDPGYLVVLDVAAVGLGRLPGMELATTEVTEGSYLVTLAGMLGNLLGPIITVILDFADQRSLRLNPG